MGATKNDKKQKKRGQIQKPREVLLSAPALWNVAMAEATIPYAGTAPPGGSRFGATDRGGDSRVGDKATEVEIRMSLESSLQAEAQSAKIRAERIADAIAAVAPEGGEHVGTTPEGYIIYRSKSQGRSLGLAGVPDTFKIKRDPMTDSAVYLKSGKALCMCRAMGACPMMASLHKPPCLLCTDPLINRYYPTDVGWWDLRDKVRLCREAARLDYSSTDDDDGCLS